MLEPGERWVFPSAEERPEVQELGVVRWRPLGEEPIFWLLPALWPSRRQRCWVPDLSPPMMASVCVHGQGVGATWESFKVEAWPEDQSERGGGDGGGGLSVWSAGTAAGPACALRGRLSGLRLCWR